MLGGGVDGQVGDWDQARHAGDVHDGALASLRHVGDEGVAEHGQWQNVNSQNVLKFGNILKPLILVKQFYQLSENFRQTFKVSAINKLSPLP